MEQKRIELKTIAKKMQEPGFDRVLVACHRSPDGDACGSSHALVWTLRQMGKEAAVYCPEPFGKDFSYLTEEEPETVPFQPEHYVTVDVADPEMLMNAPFADQIEICLDHHRTNSVSAPYRYIDSDSASCGEIVLDLIRELGLEPDRKTALAIYTALATDTGLFRYSNTNEKTFLAAAYLSRFVEKEDFYRINKLLFETKSLKRLSLESYAVSKVGFAAGGKLAALAVSLENQRELGATYSDLDVLINVIRQIEGVTVSMVAKEREEGVYKVSVRSESGFDASDFCAHFGGGGHIAAAGCTLKGNAEDVLTRLIAQAERRLG